MRKGRKPIPKKKGGEKNPHLIIVCVNEGRIIKRSHRSLLALPKRKGKNEKSP